MRGVKRFAALLALLAALLLLTGCPGSAVQGTKYTAFKEATASLCTSTDTALQNVIDIRLKREKAFRASSGTLPSKINDYEDYLEANRKDAKEIRNGLSVQRKLLALAAAYAEHLSLLATEDYAGQLETSVQKLGAGISSLDNAVDELSKVDTIKAKELKQSLGVLETLVIGYGRAVIAQERAKRLAQAMDSAQPLLDVIPIYFTHSRIEALKEDARKRVQEYLSAIAWIRPKSPLERLAFDAEVDKSFEQYWATSNGLMSLQPATENLGKAHKELRDDLDQKKTAFPALQAFMTEAQYLADIYAKAAKSE